jgi:antitoxin CptB
MHLELRRRRALYRATHRGSKEMDFLLGRFTRSAIETMSDADITALERLVEAPDPSIVESIYEGTSLGAPEIDDLVRRMRRFHGFPETGADESANGD